MPHDFKSFTTDRRTFILAATAGVAGMASPHAFAAQAVADAPMVSVGYFGGVAPVARRGGGRQSLIAAQSLTTSDPGLVMRGARVSVRGLWQRPEMRNRKGSLAIDVNYSIDGVAEKVPFYAWSHAMTAKGVTGSAIASFVAPVDNGGVELVVRKISGGIERASKLTFSVTSREGAYMLDRGAYVIALLEAGDPLPEWRSIELAEGATAHSFDRESGLLRVRSLGGSVAPSFDYIVVTFGSNVPEVVEAQAEPAEEPQAGS